MCVSFGDIIGAQKWIQEIKLTKFSLLVDQKRVLYKLFGLERSFSRVWNTKTLIYYAEQVKMNRELPKTYKDIHDDPHQMGGNFIIDIETFKILYSFKSKIPPDRPSSEDLIEKLNSFNNYQN
jgi:hypothetical protein